MPLLFPRYIKLGAVILTYPPPLSAVKLTPLRISQEVNSINGVGLLVGASSRQWRTLTIANSDNCFMTHAEKAVLHTLEPLDVLEVTENYSDPEALRIWNCVLREAPTFTPANLLDQPAGVEYYNYSFSFLIPEA